MLVVGFVLLLVVGLLDVTDGLLVVLLLLVDEARVVVAAGAGGKVRVVHLVKGTKLVCVSPSKVTV